MVDLTKKIPAAWFLIASGVTAAILGVIIGLLYSPPNAPPDFDRQNFQLLFVTVAGVLGLAFVLSGLALLRRQKGV